jgi:hypothetical protein
MVVFCLLVFLEGRAYSQSQPSGVVLNQGGISTILPPFDTTGWVLTRSSGISTHMGDDYYSHDWAESCNSEGKRLFAGISGYLWLDPAGDSHLEGYGNTLVIYDPERGFALRYAHMQEFAPDLYDGMVVLAGQYVGRVGFTGNVYPSAACSAAGGRGAHLHVTLYQNAWSSESRPVTSVQTSGSATWYSARFAYASHVRLIKSSSSPAVYSLVGGLRYPVTEFVFGNQGWNFDRNKSVFDPLKGNVLSDTQANAYPLSKKFQGARTGALIKTSSDQTVYLAQDEGYKGLPYHIFVCRGFLFSDVQIIPLAQPNFMYGAFVRTAYGCDSETGMALSDFARLPMDDSRFRKLQLGSYGADLNWNNDWELRWLDFTFEGGKKTRVFHATYKTYPLIRYINYLDPQSSVWSPWIRQ